MEKLNEFLEKFNQIIDINKEQKIICSKGVATALFDHKDFEYRDAGLKSFLTPNSHESLHTIGYINYVTVLVDPYIPFNHINIYDSKYNTILSLNYKLADII